MRAAWPVLCGVLAFGCGMAGGCTGDETFTFPEWNGGLLIDGTCPDEAPLAAVGPTVVVSDVNDWLDLEALGPGPGRISDDQASFDEMMWATGAASYILPFPGIHAVAVWYHQPNACELTIEEPEVTLVESDGATILDVQFFDSGLNCDIECNEDKRAMTVRYFRDVGPAKICRRIRPGCPP